MIILNNLLYLNLNYTLYIFYTLSFNLNFKIYKKYLDVYKFLLNNC